MRTRSRGGINIISDTSDDEPDATDPTNPDLDESDPELDPEEELPDDQDAYPDQIHLRKDMLKRLTSRRIRVK